MINDEVRELVQELVEKVVADEERIQMSDEEEIEELVEEMVRKVEEFREPEENYPDEENVGEWPNQVGGASLNVLRKREAKTKGELEGVSVVALDIEIPNDFMVDPDGADLFADNVIRLIRQNAPPTGSGTIMKAGVLFESPEITDGVGLCFKEMSKITTEDIVNNLDNMSQSNRSPLELDVPRLLMQITYLHPPKGSGVKRYRLENLLNTIALEKRKRRRLEADEEDFEALHNNEEVVAEREGHDFIDIECDEGSDEESEDDEAVAQRPDKSGVVMRNNVSDDCLPHALYQALMYHEYKNFKTEKNRVKYVASLNKNSNKNRFKKVHDGVESMKQLAGVEKTKDFDFDDIKKFQESPLFAGKYQIYVFMQNSYIPYFKGTDVGKGKELYLLLEDGHYRGVRTLCGLFKSDYYCDICETGFNEVGAHYTCKMIHRLCGKRDCPEKEAGYKKKCEKCELIFKSKTCFENHQMKGPKGGASRCDKTKRCGKCQKSVYRNKNSRPHVCGEGYCHRCQCLVAPHHHCTLMPSIKNPSKLKYLRIYFDIESRAEVDGLQVPVLFVALKCCKECSHSVPKKLIDAEGTVCSKCSPEGRVKKISCVREENRFVDVGLELVKWLFSEEHRGAVAVAHNASGYDAQFILEKLIASNKEAPKIALDGTKLVFLKHKGVKVVDSVRYLNMSLANVAKTFQIDSVKGDFPVKFIQPENFDYDGGIPDDKYYDLDNKAPAKRKELEEFLAAERAADKKFNFVEEIENYCYNDVFILASAMTNFEKSFEEMTDVCLLEESVTAASAAMQVFRRGHLKNGSPIVLDAKPAVSVNASVMSQKYMAWIEHNEKVHVQMSTTYGEKKIGKYRVDGFIDKCEEYPKGQIIDFRGCYWHGHCCKYSEESMIGDKTVKKIREKDDKRVRILEQSYPVQVVWECEVRNQLKNDVDMAEFFEGYEPMDLLHCERALVGGRTEVFRLYTNNNGKKLHYLDVVSLYPTVMKYEPYPVGPPADVERSRIPTPMTSPDQLTFMGFLSCRVVAPRDLKLPLLPGRVANRLMFYLCHKCAKNQLQGPCQHSDEERSFNGTFTTFELTKALSLGYTITEAYHGVEYPLWLKNDENNEGGLFTSYINKMMAEKIYSSGFPSNVVTDEEKEAYRDEYAAKEHINLDDLTRFIKNPGMRAVAKLLLNSLWGKFAQRVDRIQTEIITKAAKFWRLVHDTSIELIDVRPVNNIVVVQYRKQVETLTSLRTGAVHIAALTTSYARLRLYKFMEAVGDENIIYTDTDSIVFAVPDGCQNPLVDEMGPYLGQLTSEIDGEMKEFVTTGPKTYCYTETLESGEEKVSRKAKGVTMNSQVDKKFTFSKMKQLVDEVLNKDPTRTVEEFPQHKMIRDRAHNVYSKNTTKKFRYTFNKRRVLSDGSTLPYGYC